MKIISHRGNLDGPNTNEENTIEKIKYCLSLGYDVEIDIRLINDRLYLGHDGPVCEVNLDFLLQNSDKLWCHAKNLLALDYMLDFEQINCFWNNEDKHTLTSKNYIWSWNTYRTCYKTVMVCKSLEDMSYFLSQPIYGICSDWCHHD